MITAQNDQTTMLLAPTLTTAAATATSSNLDMDDAEFVTIRIPIAAEVNTNAVGPTISVQHADTTDATNFATVTANRTAEDITSAKVVRYDIDWRGKKRYCRVLVSNGDTTTNSVVTVSVLADKSRLAEAPSATSARVSGNGAAVLVQ